MEKFEFQLKHKYMFQLKLQDCYLFQLKLQLERKQSTEKHLVPSSAAVAKA